MAAGLIHVAIAWGHYFVGSFDDDASYLMAARALAAGHGLTALLPSGAVLAGAYPPGYSTLLAPLAWLWPHTFEPMRLLSVVCFALLFPLVWWYLVRRGAGFAARVAVLCLLALNPVLATYGSMVMAETPFVVGFVVLLLLADHWDSLPSGPGLGVRLPPWRRRAGSEDGWQRPERGDRARRARILTAAAVVVVAAGDVWLKEAGIGLVLGLVVWQLWQRRFWRALLVAGGTVLLLLPVVVARIVAGVPIAGSRYTPELGGYYAGGFAHRLTHVVPQAVHQLVAPALPATVVPYLSPLPLLGHWPDLWKALSLHVPILVLIGAVSWWRRYRDGAVMMGGIYLAETLLWPYINERRIILILPLVVAWYVVGAQVVWRWLRSRLRSPMIRSSVAPAGAALLATAVLAVPLAFQFPRDYLFDLHQSSSHPQNSRYMELLAHVGQPSDVVETDYESTVALFSGHRTANTAFLADPGTTCNHPATTEALLADHARYLVLGELNKPGLIDNLCILSQAATEPWAVRLLHTAQDQAYIFELIGPGTAQPDLQDVSLSARVSGSNPLVSIPGLANGPNDLTSGGAAATTAQDGVGWLEWDWSAPRPVTQVSLNAASGANATTGVSLQLDEPGRGWVTVTSSPTAVGDGPGDAPYLLASLPATTQASALRVAINGAGVVRADGVHALGPGGVPGSGRQSGAQP